MDTKEDTENGIILGNLAFAKFIKLWVLTNRLSCELKIKIYESLVVSVMLFNAIFIIVLYHC